jgi:hypothetical protein
MTNKTSGQLAFLYFDFLPAEGVRAGLLILNRYGYPEDFSYSTSINPTPLQKALYGDLLESYLLQKLAIELYAELPENIIAVFTNHPFTLSDTGNIKKPLYHIKINEEENPEFVPLYQFKADIEPSALLAEYPFELTEPFSRIEKALKLLKNEHN